MTERAFKHGILFYHEHAGQGDIYQEIGKVSEHLTQICEQLTIHLSKDKGNIRQFCRNLKENGKQQEYDVLFIIGGDGTLNELVSGVAENDFDMPIGVLPGGTFNDFTKTLNLPQRQVQAAEQLKYAKPVAMDVLKMGDEYALNFVGFGFMVQNAENLDPNSKSLFGQFSYIFSSIKTMSNPEVYEYEVTVDDEVYTGETTMVLVANGNVVGGSTIPLNDLSPSDGEVDVFIFKQHKLSLIQDFFKEKDSINWNELSENVQHIRGKQVRLATKAPTKLDIDGEIEHETPIDIQVLPQKVKLLYLDNQE